MAVNNIEDVYPMSDIQKGMVVLSEISEDRVIYHDQFVYPIPSANLDLFHLALSLLIEKHPILRTRFDLYNYSQEVQIVEGTIEFDMYEEDIKGEKREEQELRIKAFLAEERQKPFKIDQAPLWRASIFRLTDQQDIFIFQFHHAILDGWSVASFNTELLLCYRNLQEDSNYKPRKLKAAYKDALISEFTHRKDQNLKAFWQKELKEYTYLDIFGVDHTEEICQTTIDSLLSEKLERRCKQDQLLPQTIFLGAYLYALKMLTYDGEVLIGLVSNTRPNVEDGDKLLGCFLNTLPFRVSEESFQLNTWSAFFKEIDNKFKSIKAKGAYTLAEITEAIGAKGPIFDVLFNYNNFHIYDQIVSDGNPKSNSFSELFNVESYEMTNTLLDLVINKVNDHYSFLYRLSRKFRSEVSLERLHSYVAAIIEAYSGDAESRAVVNQNIIIGERERQKLLLEFNDTEVDYSEGNTALDLIRVQIQKTPDKIVIKNGDREISFKELDQLSNRLSSYLLQKYWVGPGDFVAIRLERSEWIPIAALAVLKTGAAYLPLEVDYPKDRLAFIQTDSQYKVCIDSEELEAFFNYKEESPASTAPINAIDPESVAYAIYTSGSTGLPKGAMNQHKAVLNRLLWMRDEFSITEDDILMLKSPFTFDVSVWEVLMPMITGCKVVVCKPDGHVDPLYIQDLGDTEGVTILHFVPSMLDAFLSVVDRKKCAALRVVMCGGEVLKVITVEAHQAKLPNTRIYNCYGLTEGCIDVTLLDVTDVDVSKEGVMVGPPVPNTKLYVVDKNLDLQPIGAPGEILLGGVQVAKGYLNRPELNKNKFIENPFRKGDRLYRTGDMARWLENGNMEYISRIDNQVQIRGHRIELGEIEYHLNNHEKIAKAVVLAVDIRAGEQELVAYIVAEENVEIATIKKDLADQLPPYMIPDYFQVIDEIPVTANGKVNRKVLITNYKIDLKTGKAYTPPRNGVDESIILILENILGIQKISIDDFFLDLGLNSLKAIKFVAQLNKLFSSNLTLRDVYEFNSVRDLSERIFLANVLYSEHRDDLLMQISRNDTPHKAYAVPGGLGQGFITFKDLADHMHSVSLYAFDFHGRTNNRKPLEEVRDIAADYIIEMKKVQPEGPYNLMAYCLGAKIAYEMAIQLHAAGEKVNKLYLFDGLAPDRYLDDVNGRMELLFSFYQEVFHFLNIDMDMDLARFNSLSEKDQLAFIDEIVEKSFPDKANIEELRNYIDVRMNSFYFSKNYKTDWSKKLACDVVYFRLQDSIMHDLDAYNKLTDNKMEVVMLDYGEHEGFLNEIENVQRISSVVAADLEEYSIAKGLLAK